MRGGVAANREKRVPCEPAGRVAVAIVERNHGGDQPTKKSVEKSRTAAGSQLAIRVLLHLVEHQDRARVPETEYA